VLISSEPGTHPTTGPVEGVDAYCFTHNETSTGVTMPLQRPGPDGLVLVDATSGAGALSWDPAQVDVYYFAPQKVFAGDGGLWIALLSPAAVERVAAIAATKRWTPASLDLSIALENSRLDQTYNTPALATLFLLDQQLQWMLAMGGLAWATSRVEASSSVLYKWAEASSYATPFVTDPAQRSPVVGTIDLEGVRAEDVCQVLRANGIVDTESYRKLGRNQLRIGMFPAVEPDDVAQLTRCIDFVVAHLQEA
jgi:phosphoserine aminotransferase